MQSENKIKVCADCNDKNATWCDLKYGCYLCIECAMMHKELADGSNVKSFQIDDLTKEELKQVVGNALSDSLDNYRPDFYLKPNPTSLYIIKYEYIQNKYNRKLFGEEVEDFYCGFKGQRCGMLQKKSKNNEKGWKQNYTQLKEEVLEFYSKHGDTDPKTSLPLTQLDISLQPVERKPYSISLSHLQGDELKRVYYLHGDTNRETTEWYYSILAMQHSLSEENRTTRRAHVNVTKRISKSGHLYKTGSGTKGKWKKRWVKVVNGNLLYFEDETSSYPRGEFELKASDSIMDGMGDYKTAPPTEFTFTIKTSNREYRFCALSEEEKDAWIQYLKITIH